jgi:hypothetical protein
MLSRARALNLRHLYPQLSPSLCAARAKQFSYAHGRLPALSVDSAQQRAAAAAARLKDYGDEGASSKPGGSKAGAAAAAAAASKAAAGGSLLPSALDVFNEVRDRAPPEPAPRAAAVRVGSRGHSSCWWPPPLAPELQTHNAHKRGCLLISQIIIG